VQLASWEAVIVIKPMRRAFILGSEAAAETAARAPPAA